MAYRGPRVLHNLSRVGSSPVSAADTLQAERIFQYQSKVRPICTPAAAQQLDCTTHLAMRAARLSWQQQSPNVQFPCCTYHFQVQ
jgi:hypothetical protein